MAASGAALAIEYSMIREDLLLVWAVKPSGVVASQCVDLSHHQLSRSKLGKRLQELHINMSKISKWASTAKYLHSEDPGQEKEAQEAASAGSAALQPIEDVLKVLASVLLPKEITAVLETLPVPNEFSAATVSRSPDAQDIIATCVASPCISCCGQKAKCSSLKHTIVCQSNLHTSWNGWTEAIALLCALWSAACSDTTWLQESQ